MALLNRRRSLARLAALAAGLALALAPAAPRAAAQTEPTLEYQVKAAYIFNFIQFVTWPEEAFAETPDAIVVAILGDDRFGKAIDVLEGKDVGGRRIRVKRIRDVTEAIQAPCHVLFVSASEEERADRILATTRGKPILTIGEHEEFAERGGVINFTFDEERIRFAINQDAATRGGLQISSKLLRLATIVREKR